MKWDCGETFQEKEERLKKWHRWFAWHPIKVADHDCRWLEYVERSGTYHCDYGGCTWNWSYR